MTLRLSEWRGRLPRAVLLAVVMSLIPLRIAAADERPSSKPGPIKASIEKIAVSDSGAARTARVSAAKRTQESGRSGSFFKTKTGILALAVMIAGAGYAVYSTQNDRIESPGKK